ncbi:unnamed protein product [Mytilus coruscus]|uniref:Uncharacterized protein n=1 Tax=Mytilus coruscus TaxID=42192 RepID=A0A6J8EN33_MYTCO|nr:unnamed protein product [Mytilus coruscus]
MEFFDTNSLAFGEIIRLQGEGKEISSSTERIVVRVKESFYIHDISGRHLNTIDEPTVTDSLMHLHIGHYGNITYNDRYSIYCMSLDGEMKWTYKNKEETAWHLCSTSDKKGNVYAFFRNKNRMCILKVLSRNGKLLKIYSWFYKDYASMSLFQHFLSFDNLHKNLVVFSNGNKYLLRCDMMLL